MTLFGEFFYKKSGLAAFKYNISNRADVVFDIFYFYSQG
jgi:hypothetical protein